MEKCVAIIALIDLLAIRCSCELHPVNFQSSNFFSRALSDSSSSIYFDESSFPPELLSSATYSIVDSLPDKFLWGTATAAYQVEGAADEDGSGISNWEEFSHEAGRVNHNDNGDVADDEYHRFREDIKLCADMGLSAYRISLSWSRIMPSGELPVNQEGIDHYNTVINTIIAYGMQPLVTLFHWDLPMELETKYRGWLGSEITDVYAIYAEECFKAYGDRVKYWLSFNEPWSFVTSGYSRGTYPPGRCSDRAMCDSGDSSTETYIAGHNVLNSHAKAAAIYLDKYENVQNGSLGIALNSDWAEPLTTSAEDAEAAQRFLEFQLSWFADPVFYGEYPPYMVERLGSRLPSFTQDESDLLKRTAPKWFALNHYSTNFAADPYSALNLTGDDLEEAVRADLNKSSSTWDSDFGSIMTAVDMNGDLIGPTADSPWLHVVPWGFRKIINWTYNRYKVPIIVTENGCDIPGENSLGLPFVLHDAFRIKYYQSYIEQMNLAVKEDGAPVIGYFAWSLLDNFEWVDGYSKRFGLIYVDYSTELRYPKASSAWYAKLVRSYNDESDSLVISDSPLLASSSSGSLDWIPSVIALIGTIIVLMSLATSGYYSWRRRHYKQNNGTENGYSAGNDMPKNFRSSMYSLVSES